MEIASVGPGHLGWTVDPLTSALPGKRAEAASVSLAAAPGRASRLRPTFRQATIRCKKKNGCPSHSWKAARFPSS